MLADQFELLPNTIQKRLVRVPREMADRLTEALRTDTFVLRWSRDFLADLLDVHRAAQGDILSDLSSRLRQSSIVPISRADRAAILPIWEQWHPMLVQKGEERDSAFFLKNDSLTDEFSALLQKMGVEGIPMFRRGSDKISVVGEMSREQFFEEMNKFGGEQAFDLISFHQGKFEDD